MLLDPYAIWWGQVQRLVRRQRNRTVRAAANISDTIWRDYWHAGLAPREAMARFRKLWS